MSGKPKHREKPSATTKPRQMENPQRFYDSHPDFKFTLFDMNFPSSSKDDNSCKVNKFILRLKGFESMMWKEILGPKNHPICIGQITPAAQRRLTELNQDDTDELISLTIEGQLRIWGKKQGLAFMVLWWDPNHEVYPVSLRHT